MDNIKRVLESACLNYISSEDDDEEENSEDVIENSPTNTQIDIIGKQKTIFAASYLHASNKLPMIDCEIAPMSPLPAMSPETTKLVNFLSETHEDESYALPVSLPALVASSEMPEEKSIEAAPFSPLTPRPGSLQQPGDVLKNQEHKSYALPVSLPASVASREMPEEKSIEAPPFSPLTPRPDSSINVTRTTSPISDKTDAEEYSDDLVNHPADCESINFMPLPVSLPASVAFKEMPEEKINEAPPLSPLTPRPGSLQQPGDVLENTEDKRYALPVSSPASVASREMPEEKSIEAPPFSPLTPRPGSSINDTRTTSPVSDKTDAEEYSDDLVNHPADCESIDFLPLPVSLPASVAFREMPEEKIIVAPPLSPFTPRPGSLQKPGDVLEKQEYKSYALPVSLPASVASREMSEEKSIETPPLSPLTPRPGFLQQPGDVLENEEDKKYALPVALPASVTSKEIPTEKSIEAPRFSPLTLIPGSSINVTRTTSPISDKTDAEEYSDDLVKDPSDCESIEHGEAISSENGLGESQSILTAQTEIQDMSNQSRKQHVVSSSASTEKPKQKSKEAIPTSPISDKTDFEENSDDSVKDPDFELREEDDAVSSEDSLNKPVNNTLDNNNTTEADPIINSSETITEETGRPRKGRKRKYGGYNREERKKRKYMNLSYVNSRKKLIQPKLFIDYRCNCAKKCHDLIIVEKRLTEFNKFYEYGSYDAQNMYIGACVKERPVKRQYVSCNNSNVSKKKTYSRQYFLQGIPVCREMFVKTLQTTPKRINTSLCKIRSEESITDKRGLHSGHNKVSLECELFLINVIKKHPTYVSHYRRNECNDAKFLRPDMTFPKIYNLYRDEAALAEITTVPYAKAKQVFLKKFNLRTKALKKDTCNKCDYLNNKLNGSTDEEKAEIKKLLDIHQQTAEFLQKQMKTDLKLAKDDPYTETITFDLQKTLPLPRIPTNIVFYKRQLWVYNLGIHTGSDDKAHCNVWVEGEAGRGLKKWALV